MSDTHPKNDEPRADKFDEAAPELLPDSDDEEGVVPGAAAPVEFVLPLTQSPDRLDKVLAGLMPEHSRSRLQQWIQGGHVRVNGGAAGVRQRVYPHDRITVHEQKSDEARAFTPEPMDLDIIAESPDWIVVNKPAGLVTHPGAGNWQGTLLNGLLYQYPELVHVPRAGIVHRLDKDTSGILVVARHDKAQTSLVRQLQARTVHREYGALVHEHVVASGTVDMPVGRDRRVPVRMSVRQPLAAKPAVTHYHMVRHGMLEGQWRVTELRCRLQTGRTHQIRVHMAGIGHPLLGDTLYGGRQIGGALRQMLHAHTLGFADVSDGQWREFHAPWPDDFEQMRDAIQWGAAGNAY